jgi:hypothetical protein
MCLNFVNFIIVLDIMWIVVWCLIIISFFSVNMRILYTIEESMLFHKHFHIYFQLYIIQQNRKCFTLIKKKNEKRNSRFLFEFIKNGQCANANDRGTNYPLEKARCGLFAGVNGGDVQCPRLDLEH